jgi:hypothetical protein
MFGFGLCWYGPYQYYWYNLLDYFMPIKSTKNFLLKASSSLLPHHLEHSTSSARGPDVDALLDAAQCTDAPMDQQGCIAPCPVPVSTST